MTMRDDEHIYRELLAVRVTETMRDSLRVLSKKMTDRDKDGRKWSDAEVVRSLIKRRLEEEGLDS